MTVTAYFRNELDTRWETDISGRSATIPKPYIVPEKEDSKASLRRGDIAVVRDGGVQEKSPGALGYDAQDTDSFVNVELLTEDNDRPDLTNATRSPGATRLLGFRSTVDNSADRYGGLAGEVERVCHELRKGDNEFDVVEIQSVNDVSSQEGKGKYRAIVSIRLRVIADKIDTSV